MAAGLGRFLTAVRTALDPDPRSDADLVRAYAAARSEAAFDELVRRFAPMVWGVCRRTVGQHHLAEDAFQAVFLVLVRKPGAVRPPGAVGGWLHAVAVHTALRARAMADRRRKRTVEGAVPELAEERPEPADPDALRVLDEEVARLPEKLRAAVVLCELDGLGRKEAAARLGVPEGTLSSRLATARKALAERLRARGVSLGGIAAALAADTAGAAPPLAAAPTDTVSKLADGAIRTMFLSKLKLGSLVAVAVALLTAAGGAWPRAEATDVPRTVPVAWRPAPVKAGPEGKLLVWIGESPLFLRPDGTPLDSPDPIEKSHLGVGWNTARLSADGKRLAFAGDGPERKNFPPNVPAGAVLARCSSVLKVLKIGDPQGPQHLSGVHLNRFEWLDAGTKLFVSGQALTEDGTIAETLEHWVYDATTGKRTPIEIPGHYCLHTVSRDGKTAVMEEVRTTNEKWHRHAHLVPLDGTQPTPLLELNDDLHYPRFSPDGKRVMSRVSRRDLTSNGDGTFNVGDTKFDRVVAIDLATKEQRKLFDVTEDKNVAALAWSPDGKRIAFVTNKRYPREPGAQTERAEFRVYVADVNEANAKEVYRADGSWLVGFDWR